MRKCAKCLLPETQETINYNDQGVCNVCLQHTYKKEKINWAEREKQFVTLLDQYRGKHQYDCIIPFSGGKDSTFTVYEMVKRFKVKPLVVSFDHSFFRSRTLENNDRTMAKLGVDYLKFKPSWKVIKAVMLESLKRKGDFCWHCHTGCFAYPMQMALRYKVPLLVWGEPSAEYTAYYGYSDEEEVDEKRFNRFTNLGITADDMVGMLKDPSITLRDLEPFRFPDIKELKALGVRSVCMGSYIPWDVKRQSDIIKKELGWKGTEVEGIPPQYDYEKVECMMQGIRDYLKFIKRGFGRTAHLMSLDLRNDRISVEEASKLIKEYDGKRPASLDIFLQFLGINEEEFMQIALKHVVSPHVPDLKNIKKGKKVWDQDIWDKFRAEL